MKAIQDQLVDNHCYGCGADNPHGMRIKSYFDGEVSRCSYIPRPEQCAGPTGFVYGGTLASLIDCHSVGTAIAAHYRAEGREIGTGESIWCVTGRLDVSYLAPTPIDQELQLLAAVDGMVGKKMTVQCTVMSGDTLTARGDVIAIRVPLDWRKA